MTTTPPSATLTAYTDADPCPRVEVLITPMPGDIDQITVYRSWAGQRSVVRGASRSEVAGAFLVVDYEVPLGTSVSYSSVGYDVAGIPSEESVVAAVTVSVTDMWIQDPLAPTTAQKILLSRTQDAEITVIGDSLMPVTYQTASMVSPVIGSVLPIGMAGTRQAASRMPLALIAWNPSAVESLRGLLQQAFPLCVRTPTAIPQFGGLIYLALPEITEAPFPGWEATLFSSTGDSVRGPGAGIVVQPRTYADLLSEAATYAGLVSLYPTYLDVLRGP